MTKHESLPYLEHIIDAVNDIESFTEGLTKSKFLKNKLRQSAVIRQLEIIGEASKNLPANFREERREIEWKKISGTRDKIIHHYFGIDLNTVWDIIKEDLPELREKVKAILDEEPKYK